MTIASDLFRTVTVKINDISQQLPYIVVNQADDNGKIIRFVPMDHGQKVTGFTGATIINAGGYDLADLTERIKTMYAMGELTEDEMEQLIEQAQTNAKPDDSYAPLADRVKNIETWQREVEERLSKLETGSSTDPGEPEKPVDEWPEYKQPTGAHDASCGRQNHLQRQTLYVFDGRLCVDS